MSDADDEIARSGLQFGIDWLTWARGLLVEGDDTTQALQVLHNAWQFYEAVGALWSCQVLGPDLVRMAVANGDVDLARSVAARLTALSESFRTATARGTALRCEGVIDDDADRLLAAVAAYRDWSATVRPRAQRSRTPLPHSRGGGGRLRQRHWPTKP